MLLPYQCKRQPQQPPCMRAQVVFKLSDRLPSIMPIREPKLLWKLTRRKKPTQREEGNRHQSEFRKGASCDQSF